MPWIVQNPNNIHHICSHSAITKSGGSEILVSVALKSYSAGLILQKSLHFIQFAATRNSHGVTPNSWSNRQTFNFTPTMGVTLTSRAFRYVSINSQLCF